MNFYIRLLLIIFLFPALSLSQKDILRGKISLDVHNKSLKNILETISDSCNVNFSYNPSLISENKTYSLKCRNENLETILYQILNDSLITISVVENQIIFAPRKQVSEITQIEISGKILSGKSMEPVPFAAIKIINKPMGTISDEQGVFSWKPDSLNISDSLIISAIGYKKFICPVSFFLHNRNIEVQLEDSVYQLGESLVIGYDYFQAMYWTQKSGGKFNYLLTCVTYNKIIGINFIDQLCELFGKPLQKQNTYRWSNLELPGFEDKKISVILNYFPCEYCPLENDFTLTIEIKDRNEKNLLFHEFKRSFLTDYFQTILKKSGSVGVDISQLENKEDRIYLKGSDIPYTGRCFSNYSRKKMHLEGGYIDGLQEGAWNYWFSNGQIGKKLNYIKGEIVGKAEFFYDNGQKKLEVNYINGIKNGKILYWYKNGKLRLESDISNGLADGIYRFYYPAGTLGKEAQYKKGVIISAKEWDKKGKLINRF